MTATAVTVLLCEVQSNQANISDPAEAGALSYNYYSGVVAGVNTPSTTQLMATGYFGGALSRLSIPPAVNNFTGQTGRHLNGSNFLFADGHVKWLMGTSVSAGLDAPTPASPEGSFTAAGTQSGLYQATFSPI